jgi:hypothetical protein
MNVRNTIQILYFCTFKNSTIMSLLNFESQYPDEDSYKAKFKEICDKDGIVCLHGSEKEYYWKQDTESQPVEGKTTKRGKPRQKITYLCIKISKKIFRKMD